MNFSTIKSIIIPEGNVSKITRKSDNVVLWSAGGLPNIYQQAEWVEAAVSVGAYIDLGFTFDTSARVEMEYWFFEGQTNAYPFGAVENSGSLRCCTSIPYSGELRTYVYGSNGSTYITSTFYSNDYGKSEFVFYFIKGGLQGVNITQETSSTPNKSQVEFIMTSNLYLFAQNYNGSPRFGQARRIGYFRYYDKTGICICDLVPCYRKTDGVIGMYDLARKMFFTNIGTGSFAIKTGNIIDTVGYTDGIRISTSDGVDTRDEAGYTSTGMITIPSGAKLVTSGVNFTNASYNKALIYYYAPNTEEFIGAYKDALGTVGGQSTIPITNDGNGNITISNNLAKNPVKIRLCGYGSGANLSLIIE